MKNLRQTLVASAKWLGAAIILFFLCLHLYGNLGQLRDVELELRLPRLFCSLILLVAYFIGRSLLWHQLTVMNGITFPLRRAIPVWFYSALGKYVPGKVFTLFARLHFYGKENCSAGRVSFCYFLETVCTLLAYILTALLALVLAGIEALQKFQPALIALLIVFAASLHP